MKQQRILILAMAVVAGVTAAYLIASRTPPRQGAAAAGDYYCYELRQAWVCAYAKSECEARLAREPQMDVKSRCTRHSSDDALTP